MDNPHAQDPEIAALVLGLSLTLALSLPLAACGSDETGDSTGASTEVSTTEHNDADVAFAADMIQHHAQALSMVDLTMGRDLDPEVQALADDIRAAQAPEIEAMSARSQEWGEDIPETVRDHANAGHDIEDMDRGDMGDSEMPGHDTEIADGQFKSAVDLAENIVESQTAEMEKMQGLLS